MNNILRQMLSEYNPKTETERDNAIRQIIQETVLCGLSRAGFFKKAAFCGGTALRIFYGLDRFSEDLDFSLTTPDKNFDLEKYFPILTRELNSLGIQVNVNEVEKTGDVHVKSAFVKGNTRQLYMLFYSDQKIIDRLHRDSLIKIKFEIDIDPPKYANYEFKTKLVPFTYQVQLYDLPSLFAGKLHAVIARKWRSRIKGRDLYDFVFYTNKGVKFNLKHLEARLKQSGFIEKNKTITLNDVKQMLYNRFEQIDYKSAVDDIQKFSATFNQANDWNANYFKELTKKLQNE